MTWAVKWVGNMAFKALSWQVWRWASGGVLLWAVTACSGGGGDANGSPAANNGQGASAADVAQALANCALFPAQAVFNTRIDDVARFPKHARSDVWVAAVSSGTRFHPDWGNQADPNQPNSYYGIPFNVVDGSAGTTQWTPLQFSADSAPDESDCALASGANWTIRRDCAGVSGAHFPVPSAGGVLTEGGQCSDPTTCGDHHVLVLESGACRLWEAYQGYAGSGHWTVSSSAAWDLHSMQMRTAGWTSADAAGLPILPLLARAAEASNGAVNHALRVTFSGGVMDNQPVWPASHVAGSPLSGGIPLGAALRLKSSFTPPASWSAQSKALALAMQRYGLYVADRGSNLYVQGEPNAQWSDATITQLKTLTMGDFEFVDLGAITHDSHFDATSYQASW